MNESLLWNLTGEKNSNIINNSNLPLESFIFLPVPRGGWCGLCTANSCQTQHCLLLKICLLRICSLHVFLELLHEYFLQKQFIHKVFQIIRKSVTSSFKTWPAWSGHVHTVLSVAEKQLVRQNLHHISGWVSHILVTELTKPSTSLQKGNIFSGTCYGKQMQDCSAWDCAKATCQDPARTVSKSTQALDPWNTSQQCSPAALCLVCQSGDIFTGTMLW